MGNRADMPVRIANATTVVAYGAAVMTLTWATLNNFLGDQIYGRLTMSIMALPVSVVDLLVGDMVFNVLRGGPADTNESWDFIALGWPGITMTIVLAVLLTRNRPRPGLIVGWMLATATLFCGTFMLIDTWAPRRPWGLPLLACGLIMATGLVVLQRRRIPIKV